MVGASEHAGSTPADLADTPAPARDSTANTAQRVRRGEGRERLLAAFVRIAARDGVDRVTYRALAREAGVSSGLASYHFPDRETLLREALLWAVDRAIDASRLSVPYAPRELFGSEVSRLVAEAPEEAVFQYELMIKAWRDTRLKEQIRALYDHYIDATQDALTAIGLPADRSLASLVFAVFDGMTIQQLIFDRPHDTDKTIDLLRRALEPLAEHMEALLAGNHDDMGENMRVPAKTDGELLAFDAEHICHGVTPIGTNIGFIVDRAEGVSFFDTTGKEYLDGSSQLVCVSLGYRYKDEIAEAAAEQIRQLPYLTTFWGLSCKPLIEATERLIELTPEGIERFWFTTGGSETTETAMQFARRYWRAKGSSKHKIISLYNSYHGVMFGSITATGVAYGGFSQDYTPLVPGFVKAPSYYCYRCMLGKEYPECGVACAKQLEKIIMNEGAESVAAFIAEPMHGTAGDIPPVPEYWPLVREICDRHNVLLIADEVMTGFGRTGKAFAVQHWDVLPDMLCMAKGITSTYVPFGALGMNEKVYAGMRGMVIPGQTWGGHPLGATVASKVMEIYVRDKVFENAAAMGAYAMERLEREFSLLPHVGEISGLGLQIGIEIVEDKETRQGFDPQSGVMLDIFRNALDGGLLVRTTDESWSPSNRLSFAPPLIVTAEEVDRMLDVLYPIVASIEVLPGR